MFGKGIGWPEIILILAVVLLLFGAKRLPDTARGLGRSLRIFKAETKGLTDDDSPAPPAIPATPPVETPVPPPVSPAVSPPVSPPGSPPVPQSEVTPDPGGQR
jgi:sec-independent protein translocase protein TatA